MAPNSKERGEGCGDAATLRREEVVTNEEATRLDRDKDKKTKGEKKEKSRMERSGAAQSE